MKIEKYTTKSNKNIVVIDDLFDYASRNNFFSFVTNSLFCPKGRDNNLSENSGDYNLFSNYSEDDMNKMGFLGHPNAQIFNEYVEGYRIQQIRVNLSTLNDQNRFHVDTPAEHSVTVLYYPNMNWKLEWGGYTLFGDETITEIEKSFAYIPGRVIIFDGRIPHCIAAPTNLAPSYRYSLAIQYIK